MGKKKEMVGDNDRGETKCGRKSGERDKERECKKEPQSTSSTEYLPISEHLDMCLFCYRCCYVFHLLAP